MTASSLPVARLRRVDAVLERSITAVCEALFPVNPLGAPDWESTNLVPRMREYLGELPPPQRRQLIALFLSVEYGAPLLGSGFRRFSRQPPDLRADSIRRWRRSTLVPVRMIGDALKAVTTILYMSHPAALAHVGAYKTCARPGDTPELRVDRHALTRLSNS